MRQFSIKTGLFLLMLFSAFQQGFAQNNQALIQDFLNENREKLALTQKDISDWIITDQYTGEHSGITHTYLRQRHQGIEVHNAVANFNIKDGKVLSMGDRLLRNMAANANTTTPAITPTQAIQKAAEQLNLTITEQPKALEPISMLHFVFSNAGISKENIPVKLMYQPDSEGKLFLVWDLTIYQNDGQHWWSLRLDAQSGQIIDKVDWILKCSFPDGAFGNCNNPMHGHHAAPTNNPSPNTMASSALLPDQYRVFAMPLESPNHGARTLEVDPKDSLASPYGWHDTNGATGPEFTITRGNNVHAYEDTNDNDAPGYSPDGGSQLNFDFPLNLSQAPAGYFDPAITNLFYWNNVMHDVWYRYGFTEQAGNFQENNYGRGGAGSDYVYAEAQDGGGTNNANFGTPADGGNPRMQMYLWAAGGGPQNFLTVNSPAGIAGVYSAIQAAFGAPVPSTPITSNLVLFNDNTAPNPNDACEPAVNAAAMNGKIVVIMRGDCEFGFKILAAENAGATAVIMINNVAGSPVTMAAGAVGGSVTIPSVMISNADGTLIMNQMATGTVNATLVNPNGVAYDKDGDFDNGIIAHEYGHGISNRLTGGPAAASCLSNAEQMGEGWSDFFGLMLTIEPGDTSLDARGIGTFATNEPVTGGGIRNAPYTTDMAINPYTYDDVSNTSVSQPHGIGFVWCTMLWDLNWAMIDRYGVDYDFYTGTGGNNMTMRLVMEGLKLQPCSPGFVDGRDAILLADQQLYGGANQCLIWEVFARRGLGFSASQGLSTSRTDQTPAYDIPAVCQNATVAPVAGFNSSMMSSCNGVVNFTDLSTNIPQYWSWAFGDGAIDSVQNPTHTYSTAGTYTVTLTVSNSIGSNTTTQVVNISLPTAPVINGANICSGQSATLSGSVASGNSIVWYNASGSTPIDTALNFTTPVLSSSTSYRAENVQFFPPQNVGPTNGQIGAGGHLNSATAFQLNFEAYKAFTLVSVWVDAALPGSRTINVYNAYNGGGTIVATVNAIIPTGQTRVQLDIVIPGPGQYSIGMANANLYRNTAGVNYPYDISGLVSINGSSTGTSNYYYLYDWEVQEAPCRSPMVTVPVTVNAANFSSVQTGLSLQLTDLSTGASSYGILGMAILLPLKIRVILMQHRVLIL